MAIEFKIPDMACAACGETITQAVIAIDPKASVKANLENKQVTVNTQASKSAIKQAISDAGYSPA